MELRHLRYFLAVADTHNFTQAAADCYVAQSALSRQIARLEKEVGASLFSRTSRSVRLTAAGELLEPLARRILADVEDAQPELDALAGLRREPGQHLEVAQIHDMLRLASAGVGVTVVPRASVRGMLHGGAKALRIDDPAAVHHVSVVYDSTRLAPAAAAFLQIFPKVSTPE